MESYVTLMSVESGVFLITLIHPCNFTLANVALNMFPEDPDGPDPQVPVPVIQLHPDVRGHLEGVPDYHFCPYH